MVTILLKENNRWQCEISLKKSGFKRTIFLLTPYDYVINVILTEHFFLIWIFRFWMLRMIKVDEEVVVAEAAAANAAVAEV